MRGHGRTWHRDEGKCKPDEARLGFPDPKKPFSYIPSPRHTRAGPSAPGRKIRTEGGAPRMHFIN
jgi:hypothetical protein